MTSFRIDGTLFAFIYLYWPGRQSAAIFNIFEAIHQSSEAVDFIYIYPSA